ncbi:hypothetical protein ANCCAN_08577 [Ancylostoma caninum]|uniref:Uncharacterized protein n=1 Tax=Ancylostoma caninum TaxID=29170 RepID=A0A368GR63_ANCCA|nr:hypothetical protein ANCCAN_08577 [Ancylostoma caninum]
MRGWERSSWAHDVVRMAAVAPVPKQFTKHSRPRHSDEPLSDSGGEEPRKIRSYIKPNKNVNTYREAMREQRMVARLINGQRPLSGTSKRPTAAVRPIFPVRQELHDTNSRNPEKVLPKQSTAAKNHHPAPTPTTSKAKYSEMPTLSVPAHVKNARSSPSNAPSCNSSGKPGSAPRTENTFFPRKNTEGPRNGVGSHTCSNEKQSFKRRDIPKPPPLPQKRAQAPSSAKIDRPQSCHQQEWKDSSPPAKKLREEPRTSLPSAAIINQRVEEETTRPRVGTTLNETLKWNEHSNLAYLFKRHMKIFTLATLPNQESWYHQVMEGNAPEDKTAGRMSRSDSAAAERSNLGYSFARESTPKMSEARSCEISTPLKSNPASREGPGSSLPDQCRMSSVYVPVCGASTISQATFDATAFVGPAFSQESGREELRNSSRRKSCLATVKKQAKKRISFSEDLVSTYYYESDSHIVWQEDQAAAVTSEEMRYRSQTCQDLQWNAEYESMQVDPYEGTQPTTLKGDVDSRRAYPLHSFTPAMVSASDVTF